MIDKLPISVIVVAKNSEKTIGECLEAIQKNRPSEIIVIDGDSDDQTKEIAKKYTHMIFSDAGKGLGYARQLGAEMAGQEYIAFVDSHVILLDESILMTMLDEFINSNHISIGARLASGMKYSNYWEWSQYQHDLYSQMYGHRKNYFSTMAGLTRKSTILKYRFNLSREIHIDDLDIEYKLKKDRHTFGLSLATIQNLYRSDFSSLFKQRYLHYGIPAAYYICTWGILHAYLWPPIVMFYWIGFCILRGKPKLIPYFLFNGFAQTAGMIKGFVDIMFKTLKKGIIVFLIFMDSIIRFLS